MARRQIVGTIKLRGVVGSGFSVLVSLGRGLGKFAHYRRLALLQEHVVMRSPSGS